MKVLVVGCLHGHEAFGLKVVSELEKRPIDGIDAIIGNPRAAESGVRFIDADLNRSFGKNGSGYEFQRAKVLLSKIDRYDYLIDIHSTTTRLSLTPIIASLGLKTKRLINLLDSKEIAWMPKSISQNSLIGSFGNGGISLEFGEMYSRTPAALEEVLGLIEGLINKSPLPPKKRELYIISGLVPEKYSREVQNFSFKKDLGGYAFLVGEGSYSGFNGFIAEGVEKLVV